MEKKFRSAPARPGVYIIKDKSGRAIYVGKAKSLRQRLPSYLRARAEAKVMVMIKRAAALEFILTANEIEALALEGNLIKKHRPRYNVSWRDDKSFPFLRLSTHEEFPALSVSRRPGVGMGRFFGPFVRVRMREMLALINKHFAVRNCKSFRRYKQGRPCLNYQIKRCLAPCAGKVDEEEYAREVERLVLFLTGHNGKLKQEMTVRMERAAAREEFEQAARLRDLLAALDGFSQRQRAVQERDIDQDILALAEEKGGRCLQVLFVREGKLCGEYHAFLEGGLTPRDGGLASFIGQFYADLSYLPPRIVCDRLPLDKRGLERWLAERRGGRVAISAPRAGRARPLLTMAAENAAYHLGRRLSSLAGGEELAGHLRRALSLKAPPKRIEAFDISHTGGDEAVGSMVVFQDGETLKSAYRRFKIKTGAGVDDYAMMREVLGRRYRRLAKGEGEIPDLVLVDGGRGHLALARALLASLGLAKVNVLALAKRQEVIFRGREDPKLQLGDKAPRRSLAQRAKNGTRIPPASAGGVLYRAGRDSALKLAADSAALLYLRRVRDEAHRFARAFHHLRRKKGYKKQ